MFALTEHILHKNILCLDFLDRFLLQFRILFKSVRNICKSGFQLHGRLSCLVKQRFIHDDGVVLADSGVDLLVNYRKFL